MRLLQRNFGGQPGDLAHQPQEGHRGHVGDEGVGLGHVADARLHFAGTFAAVVAQNAGASGGRAVEAEEGADQGGLAGAVRAEQPDGLPGPRNAEPAGDLVQDLPPAQTYAKPFEFNNWSYLLPSPTCPARCGPAAIIIVMIVLIKRVRLVAWIRSLSALTIIKIGSRLSSSVFNAPAAEDRGDVRDRALGVEPEKARLVEAGRNGQLRPELLGVDKLRSAVAGGDGLDDQGTIRAHHPVALVIGPPERHVQVGVAQNRPGRVHRPAGSPRPASGPGPLPRVGC